MGLRDRRANVVNQRDKRRKKRAKLAKKGLNPDDFYSGRVFIGHDKKQVSAS
jgi:hypothetical protein